MRRNKIWSISSSICYAQSHSFRNCSTKKGKTMFFIIMLLAYADDMLARRD